MSNSCGLYEDDTVPLRIHDCSLDLMVITDSEGLVCICHHYLYQVIYIHCFKLFIHFFIINDWSRCQQIDQITTLKNGHYFVISLYWSEFLKVGPSICGILGCLTKLDIAGSFYNLRNNRLYIGF